MQIVRFNTDYGNIITRLIFSASKVPRRGRKTTDKRVARAAD